MGGMAHLQGLIEQGELLLPIDAYGQYAEGGGGAASGHASGHARASAGGDAEGAKGVVGASGAVGAADDEMDGTGGAGSGEAAEAAEGPGRGRPPKGKVWSTDTQEYVDDGLWGGEVTSRTGGGGAGKTTGGAVIGRGGTEADVDALIARLLAQLRAVLAETEEWEKQGKHMLKLGDGVTSKKVELSTGSDHVRKASRLPVADLDTLRGLKAELRRVIALKSKIQRTLDGKGSKKRLEGLEGFVKEAERAKVRVRDRN